jgi:hypothetical protein
MAIDTDILSFGEYNANCNDENTKINQITTLVANSSLSSADTNKIPVRRSSVWVISGEESYNGMYQDFGNISGEVSLSLNGHSCRTAMVATVIGNSFIVDFSGILTGVVYSLFLKQNATGGYSVRWPYGASVLKSVGTDPNQITEAFIVKIATGKLFIRCEAFRDTVDIGLVIKEFEPANITYPDGTSAPLQFVWTKAPAVSYGGTLTGLYSDWEIASDSLYSVLLFSSYNNTVDITSIQVILTEAGTVYMRTRYGGNINSVPVLSSWDEAIIDLESGAGGDNYWDNVVYYLPFTGYDQQYWFKEIKGSANFYTNDSSYIRIVAGTGPQSETSFMRMQNPSTGTGHYILTAHNPVQWIGTSDFCFEFFGKWDSVPGNSNWAPLFFSKRGSSSDYGYGCGYFNGNIQFWYSTTGSNFLYKNFAFTPAVDGWHHFAFYRISGVLYFTLDGVLRGSLSFSDSIYNATSPFKFFGDGWNSNQSNFSMCHFRFTKNIGRYPVSGFTVPEIPYQTRNVWWTPKPVEIAVDAFTDSANWDKVECLINGYGLANSTSISDESGKFVSVNGNAKIDVTSNLSSIIFDGSGDYLYIGAAGDFNFLHNGIHPWTIEFWFNPSAVNTGDWILDTTRGSFSNYGILMGFGNVAGQIRLLLANGNGSTGIIDKYFTEYTFAVGTTYHVAFTYDHSLASANLKMFVNGTQVATANKNGNTPSLMSGYQMMLGGFSTSYLNDMFNGKIYSFRISRYLRYTSNFTVDSTRPYFPAKPKVQNWVDTSLLINAFDLSVGSVDIRDQKGSVVSVIGDTKIGAGFDSLPYIDFDGTGDYLSVPLNTALFSLGTSDFTIECYFSLDSLGSYRALLSSYGTWTSVVAFYLRVGNTNYPRFLAGNSIPLDITSSVAVAVNTLYHIAVCRVSGVTTMYLNGINVGSSSTAATITNTVEVRLGSGSDGLETVDGKIYSVRIIKGKALYTSNFYADLTRPYFPAVDSISDFWLDANDYSKLTFATGVSQITDKSSNNYNPVQGTPASQPSLVQNALNGLMALNFDGVDDYMTMSVPQKMHNCVFFVLDTTNLQTGSRCILNRTTSSSPYQPAIYAGRESYNYKPSVYWGTTWNGTSSITVQKPHILCVVLSNPIRIYVDGNLVYSGANAETVLSSWIELPTINTYSQQACFKLNELLIGVNFTDNFIQKLSGYFAHKWGLLSYLDVNYPYKSSYPTANLSTDDLWFAVLVCLNPSDIIRPTEIVDSRRMSKTYVYGDTKVLIDSNNAPYINLDGSDYMEILSSLGSAVGANDFTLEFFYSAGSTALGTVLSDASSYGGYYGIRLDSTASGTSFSMFMYDSSSVLITIGSSITTNYGDVVHVAITRQDTSIKMYINGVLAGSNTITSGRSLYNTGSRLRLGLYGTGQYFTGKIYGLRLTKSRVRYTSTFSVPSTNFPILQNQDVNLYDKYWNNVVFNISSELGTITDYKGRTISNAGVTISTALGVDKPSLYFNGSSYFTELATDCGFLVYKNSDFTLEFFIWATTTSNYRGFMQYGTNNNNYDPSATFLFNSGSRQVYNGFCGSSGAYGSQLCTCPDELAHVAFCFNNTTRILKTFVNGSLVDSSNIGPTNSGIPANGNIYFGRYTGGTFYFTGHITSMRLTKNVERYTANFTPLSKPYFPRMV